MSKSFPNKINVNLFRIHTHVPMPVEIQNWAAAASKTGSRFKNTVTPHFLCINCVWPKLLPHGMQNRVTWECSRRQLAKKWIFHVVLLLMSYFSAFLLGLWFSPSVLGSHSLG